MGAKKEIFKAVVKRVRKIKHPVGTEYTRYFKSSSEMGVKTSYSDAILKRIREAEKKDIRAKVRARMESHGFTPKISAKRPGE